MRVLRLTDAIYTQEYMKKFVFAFISIFILFISLFLGLSYIRKYPASLSSIITAFVAINPLDVQVSVPPEVEINKTFQVRAEVTNKGEDPIENLRGEIFLPPELILVSGNPIKGVGVLRGGQGKKISWGVKAEKEGSFIITVLASGNLRGELISAEDSATVNATTVIKGRGRPAEFFQRFFDFIQDLFQI